MLVYFGSLASAGRVKGSRPRPDDATGYAATIDGLPGGPPLAHWRLGEASGTQMIDRKAGARHGTYSGTIGYAAAALPQDSDGAIDFGDPGSGASVPHDAGLALSAFTLSFWLKPNSLPAEDSLAMPFFVKNAEGSVDGDFMVYTPSTGDALVRVRFLDRRGNRVDLDTMPDFLTSGTVYHVCVRADNTGFDLYVNGIYQGKNTGYLSAWSLNTAAIEIAVSTGFTGVFDGVIDEIALYDRVLTEAEVLALAQQTSVPVAVEDFASIPESQITDIDVLVNDKFVGTPTINIESQPGGGDSWSVVGQKARYVAGAVGADTVRSFTYSITDPNGQSNIATVNVIVLDSGAPPPSQANCFAGV